MTFCRTVVDTVPLRRSNPYRGIHIYERAREKRVQKLQKPVCKPASRWIKADRLHSLIPRESPRWWKLHKGRAAIEFGRVKNEWALLPLRIRGLERVQLHADLTILAKLSCALARARAVPLAA